MSKLPAGVNIHNLIDNLRIFSWEAADILLYYSKILRNANSQINLVKNNDEEDPVTIADLKVNQIILKRIKEKYPNIGWKYLSEENTKFGSTKCDIDADWLWILDPLDGTKDFIQGTDNYAMHLALNYKNKPILGIVLIPEKEELWIADGKVTWCEGRDLLNKKISLTNKKSLNKMTLVTSKNHSNHILRSLINKIDFEKTLIMGSIGCKIASIIRGESDIYISMSLPGQSAPKDWDFAAPAIILKNAGGVITNIENEEISFNQANFEQKGILIASNNKETHQEICNQIKEIIKKFNLYP